MKHHRKFLCIYSFFFYFILIYIQIILIRCFRKELFPNVDEELVRRQTENIDMPPGPYLWLDVDLQEWHLWRPLTPEEGVSLPLGLPSYASEEDVQRAAHLALYQQEVG